MKPVICFGEALIDFLNTRTECESSLPLNHFTQFPGGAPANAAVAVAKQGGKAFFVGQVGDDEFGHFLQSTLQGYGVNTSSMYFHATAQTALAFVFLDEEGERSFSFYRDNTADLLLNKQQIHASWFEDEAILHFCSNTLTDKNITEVTQHIVNLAKENKALVSFDVNLRHNLWLDGKADINVVNSLVKQAHLLKFTREEMDFLSNDQQEKYIEECFDAGVKAILLTDGGKTLSLYLPDHFPECSTSIQPPETAVVDTTGGGDSFIGAVLFALSQESNPISVLSDLEKLLSIVEFACHCGAFTVSRKGAMPALPVFDDVKEYWRI